MISDELLKKFNNIEDLPVSEEMLGAYLEGNLDFLESAEIKSMISDNIQLSAFCQEISATGSIEESYESIADSYLAHSNSEIELPVLDFLPINLDHLNEMVLENSAATCIYEDIDADLTVYDDLNEENNLIDIGGNLDGDIPSDDISSDNTDGLF